MHSALLRERLEHAAEDPDDFEWRSREVIDALKQARPDVSSVDVILQFMETHSDVDYGAPGPLVHFVEEFYRAGYEERLLQSLRRRPTPETVSMLNRLINGANDSTERSRLIAAMERAGRHDAADDFTRERVVESLAWHRRSDL